MLNHPSKGLNFNGVSRREGGGERFVEGRVGGYFNFLGRKGRGGIIVSVLINFS